MADATVKLGYWGALRNFYQIMSGRYASMGIELLPGYFDHSAFLAWYWVVPTTIILATLFSTYILLNTLNTFVLAATFTRSLDLQRRLCSPACISSASNNQARSFIGSLVL